MHEVGITRSLVEIAEEHVRAAGHNKVLSVSVDIGDLSGVVAEAVEFCYDAVIRGTLLEGSRLIINRIPGAMRCRDCQDEFPADNYTLECPQCGGFLLDFTQGKELRMTELEVE
mgnify:FL=1